jgi:hypothetical protein
VCIDCTTEPRVVLRTAVSVLSSLRDSCTDTEEVRSLQADVKQTAR